MSARPTPPCRGSLAFREIVFPLELCSWLHLCYPCPVNGRAHCSLLIPCSFLLSQPPEIRRGGTLWQPDGRQGLWSAFLAARGLTSKAPEHSSKCPRCVKAPSDLLGTAGLRPPRDRPQQLPVLPRPSILLTPGTAVWGGLAQASPWPPEPSGWMAFLVTREALARFRGPQPLISSLGPASPPSGQQSFPPPSLLTVQPWGPHIRVVAAS